MRRLVVNSFPSDLKHSATRQKFPCHHLFNRDKRLVTSEQLTTSGLSQVLLSLELSIISEHFPANFGQKSEAHDLLSIHSVPCAGEEDDNETCLLQYLRIDRFIVSLPMGWGY